METVECIVVGGGLAGLSAAYGLAEAGSRSWSSSAATTPAPRTSPAGACT